MKKLTNAKKATLLLILRKNLKSTIKRNIHTKRSLRNKRTLSIFTWWSLSKEQKSIIYCLSRDRIGRIYKCLLLFFQTLLGAGHTMHICTAIETGDQHYNRLRHVMPEV